MHSEETKQFRTHTKSAIGFLTFAVVSLLLIWFAADLVLLAFLSTLLAIFLRGLSDPLAQKVGWPPRVTLWIVIVVIGGGLYLAGYLFSGDIADQVQELSKRLPKAFAQLKENIEHSHIGRQALQWSQEMDRLLQKPGVISGAKGAISATFGFFSGLLVVVVAGVFLAHDPKLYVEGILRLFRPQRRERMREVFGALYHSMRWWLFGKAISMTFIGTVSWIGLELIGVQLALVLGLVAGTLAFVPFIGPLASAVPALLLALVQNPTTALHVALLYGGIQFFEGNILTPVIERRTVRLPPALTLFAQLLAGLSFGLLGVLLASPLTAAGMVLVKMLYIEDKLEQNSDDSH